MTYDPTPPGARDPFVPAPTEPTGVPTSVPTMPVTAAPPVMASATPGAVARKKSSGGGILNVVLVVAAAVAIGGVAFAIGRGTAPTSAAAANGRGNQGVVVAPGGSFVPRGSGQPGFGGGRGGFGGGLAGGGLSISGTVESIDGDTMTIKTASGQTIEVTTGDTTTYHSQAPATAADVKTGSTVQVQLDFNGQGGGAGRPTASGAPAGPVGTAGSVTVIP